MFRYGYKVQQRAEKTGFVAVILFLLSACMQTLKAQSATQTVDSLVNMGYENVSWHENEEERIYVLENVASRLSTTGISEAVGMITRKGLPEHKTCRIVFLDNNIPQLSLVYRPVVADSLIGKPVVTPEWKTTADVGTGWRQAVRSGVRNSSLFKVDLVIYPELMLKNLVITQIYQVLFNLSPAIEISLWKGMKLTAQMVFPVYNDGYGKDYRIMNMDSWDNEALFNMYLTAYLLSLYEQTLVYQNNPLVKKRFLIAKPLGIFVGGSVNAVRTVRNLQVSDVVQILLFLQAFIDRPAEFTNYIRRLFDINDGIKNRNGYSLFANSFEFDNSINCSK